MSGNDIKIVLVAKHSKNDKFETLLKQVYPQEIPVTMIDSIVLEFVDGTSAKLDHSELKDPLPTAPDTTWQRMHPIPEIIISTAKSLWVIRAENRDIYPCSKISI